MRRLMIPVALALVIGLASYAIFAQPQQPPGQAQRGMGGGMMGGGMMGRGMMGDMGCPGCAAICAGMMQESLTATTDGGVVVAVAGKLVKYDNSLKKVSETDVDVDWTAMHQRMQQMMRACPMMQQRMQAGPAAPQADHEQHHPSQP